MSFNVKEHDLLYAVIDIGSNAARLLFANAWMINGESYVEKASLIRIPLRLGNDVFANGKISKQKAKDMLSTMKAYKLLIDVYKPSHVKVLATAAMREAQNAEKLIQKIKEKTSLEIEVISGQEEANIIRSTNKIPMENPNRPQVFIDVGGGSTEISIMVEKELLKLHSFKVGTLRMLHEKYDPNIWTEMAAWFQDCKRQLDDPFLVGSGGNINKLNKIFGDVNSKILSKNQLQNAYNELSALSEAQRMNIYGFRPDRADVIVPAAEIYLQVMNILNASEIYVPKIGLADGMVHLLHQKDMSIG